MLGSVKPGHIEPNDRSAVKKTADQTMLPHRSEELKEMLPEGLLNIAIRAHFWQPQKNDRKAELIKYWHQRAVLDRLNI